MINDIAFWVSFLLLLMGLGASWIMILILADEVKKLKNKVKT